jgi:dTMP kinase
LERGVLIAIEGIDGAGKSTQAALLRDLLVARGYDVASFKEPTGSEAGKKIRELGRSGRKVPVLMEFELFLEDRRFDVSNNILPALKAKKVVVIDRYYHSSMAYQGARGMDPKVIEDANLKFSPRPDLVVFLDISVPTAESRIHSRNEAPDHFEQRLTKVREIFAKIAETHPEVKLVSGEGEADTVQAQIEAIVLPVVGSLSREIKTGLTGLGADQ